MAMAFTFTKGTRHAMRPELCERNISHTPATKDFSERVMSVHLASGLLARNEIDHITEWNRGLLMASRSCLFGLGPWIAEDR
jgi:hypothetical protein